MGVTLEARDLTRYFGAVRAADGINVLLRDGELVGMVGANGAGKTTFLNLITGYVKPTGGSILYRGTDITGMAPRAVTRLGIARSFQIPQLFAGLTVLENALIALAATREESLKLWSPLKEPRRIEEAIAALEPFGLAEHAHHTVEQLSDGERKLLDIALALVLRPRLLLMDEATSGVSHTDKFPMMDTVVAVLKESGVTTLFVEHDMDVIQKYAERVLVLNEGKILADDSPDAVFSDATVRRVVLGYAGG